MTTGLDNALEFYLVVTPGLENVLVQELSDWLEGVNPEVSRGGVTVRLPLALGLSLNRYLKTPTRILLRIADFGCRDFPKLFRKMNGFPWEEWTGEEVAIDFSASSHTSRLRVKKRIEETCAEAWQARLKKRGYRVPTLETAKAQATVLVRFNDDVCTVSLDTSGEILHKRGVRPLVAEAPLRETTAASLLLLLENLAPVPSDANIELVDPMMGGGTFLIEARDLRTPVVTRPFAFEAMRPLLAQAGFLPELKSKRPLPYSCLVGYEADEKTYRSACENIEADVPDNAEGEESISRELHRQDFFKAAPLAAGPERWVIANPPYGERLKIEGRLVDYYSGLFAQAERVARPVRACFLLPAKANPERLKLPEGWQWAAKTPFQNGGIPVIAHLFVRTDR